MSKEIKLSGNINLSKIDEKNLFWNKHGEPVLNIRIIVNDGRVKIAQRFLENNRIDENGEYHETPVLGKGIIVRGNQNGIIKKMFKNGK